MHRDTPRPTVGRQIEVSNIVVYDLRVLFIRLIAPMKIEPVTIFKCVIPIITDERIDVAVQ